MMKEKDQEVETEILKVSSYKLRIYMKSVEVLFLKHHVVCPKDTYRKSHDRMVLT